MYRRAQAQEQQEGGQTVSGPPVKGAARLGRGEAAESNQTQTVAGPQAAAGRAGRAGTSARRRRRQELFWVPGPTVLAEREREQLRSTRAPPKDLPGGRKERAGRMAKSPILYSSGGRGWARPGRDRGWAGGPLAGSGRHHAAPPLALASAGPLLLLALLAPLLGGAVLLRSLRRRRRPLGSIAQHGFAARLCRGAGLAHLRSRVAWADEHIKSLGFPPPAVLAREKRRRRLASEAVAHPPAPPPGRAACRRRQCRAAAAGRAPPSPPPRAAGSMQQGPVRQAL